jgi:hypothetical protein
MNDEEDKPLSVDTLKNHFESNNEIGGYKIEHQKPLPEKYLYIKDNELINIPDFEDIQVQQFADEYDTETINKYLTEKRRVFIGADFPGCGKSEICKNFDKSSLFTTVFNKLCQNIEKGGFKAITFHRLFGLDINDQQSKNRRSYDINDYNTIVIDECMLLRPDK